MNVLQNAAPNPEIVLQVGMAKPPTSVRSIRLPDEQWAALVKLAEARKITVNAAVAGAVARMLSPPMVMMAPDEGFLPESLTPGQPVPVSTFAVTPAGKFVALDALTGKPLPERPRSRLKVKK